MIYLDSSVVLAYLFAETRRPAGGFWADRFLSSRLLQYEVWNRLHARGLAITVSDLTQAVFDRVSLVDLTADVLDRALDPFPVGVRTVDALHLATLVHLRESGIPVTLASYDARLVSAARALDFEIAPL